ncbi:MAG TPA: NADH-quinone oxidoreductase subunit N [Planctomycetota bacterium]|nr:NADH-quinone oxidoreductase subunit N [Planctomycetota bacterium]
MDWLAQTNADVGRIWPEIILSVTALVALLSDLLLKGRDTRVTGWVTTLGVVFTIYWIARSFAGAHGGHVFGMMLDDRFALFFKLLIASGLLVVTLLSMWFRGFDHDGIGEYYSILVTAAVGAFFLVSTDHLLLLFLGLETLSISSYVLAGFLKRDIRSTEAAVKYLVFGVLASGAMLFGFSLLYGFTGSVRLPEIGSAVQRLLLSGAHGKDFHLDATGMGVAVGVILSLAGFGFKVAAFPFHFWSPDVYEGAPTPVTTFLSVVSKTASFGMILRFFGGVAATTTVVPDAGHAVVGSPALAAVLAAIAAMTMTFGNVAAMLQENAKRLLAYSSIAHAGYMLAGVAAFVAGADAIDAHGDHYNVASLTGAHAVAFYLAAYFMMNLGAFAVVTYLSNRWGAETVGGWAGLGWKSPVACGALAVFLLSLTGIPPTAGFVGKWYLLQAIWTAPALQWLAVLLVLNSIVSLFYYFRMAKSLFFKGEEEATASPRKHAYAFELSTIVVALAVGTLWFGLSLSWLMNLVQSLHV